MAEELLGVELLRGSEEEAVDILLNKLRDEHKTTEDDYFQAAHSYWSQLQALKALKQKVKERLDSEKNSYWDSVLQIVNRRCQEFCHQQSSNSNTEIADEKMQAFRAWLTHHGIEQKVSPCLAMHSEGCLGEGG